MTSKEIKYVEKLMSIYEANINARINGLEKRVKRQVIEEILRIIVELCMVATILALWVTK